MSNFFEKLPIKRKMIVIIMAIISIVFFFALMAFVLHDVYFFKKALTEEINTLAYTIGINSTSALTFNDQQAAKDTLLALKANPNITEAHITRNDGKIFASYINKDSVSKPAETLFALQLDQATLKDIGSGGLHYFKKGYLNVFRPIILSGEYIGIVIVRTDLQKIFTAIKWSAASYVLTLGLLVIIAYLISNKLSGKISKPINHLVETMQMVSDNRDYSLRATTKTEDELGALIKSFNDMLEGIENRNTTISIAKSKLEKEIEERHKMEKQLQQAHKMEAIGTLAGGIAHDFNNILTAIIGYAQLILVKNKTPGTELEHDVGVILKSSDRAKKLIQQLLTFSRRTEHSISSLELASLIKETTKLLRASSPASIDFEIQIIDNPTILADATQIYQLITNLCTNAVHAIGESSGVLTITLQEEELNANDIIGHKNMQQGKYAKITVRDTGTGMDSMTLNRIFDPFFTTKEVGKGTGMGLSVVHGVVERYGGMMQVESELEKGTVFYVFFPLSRSSDTISVYTNASEKLPRGTENILLVDDEEDIREMGRRLFETYGYFVTTAINGCEALELFKKSPTNFDLLITDRSMPKMNGVQLAEKIIKLSPKIPIIMITGNCDMLTDEITVPVGIRKYLHKPFTSEILHDIRSVLDQSIVSNQNAFPDKMN